MNPARQIHQLKFRAGFSLAEMLVVIAIIGILASIAVAFISGSHRETMIKIRDQRTAQEVASVAISAYVAEADFVKEGDMKGTILNLIEGRRGKAANFTNYVFRLNPLDEDKIDGALKYLDWEDNHPIYVGGRDE